MTEQFRQELIKFFESDTKLKAVSVFQLGFYIFKIVASDGNEYMITLEY